MTPREMIADLDASLRRDGEDVVLQRLTLGPGGIHIPFTVICRAHVRFYRLDELIGVIKENDQKVILSPTQIMAAGWTSGRPAHEDRRVPMPGNRIVIKGRPHRVELGSGLYPAGELVRIELVASGAA
jgi:hypothetical protein